MGITIRDGKIIKQTNIFIKEGFALKEAIKSYDYTQKLINNKISINEQDYSNDNLELISNLIENLSQPAEEE